MAFLLKGEPDETSYFTFGMFVAAALAAESGVSASAPAESAPALVPAEKTDGAKWYVSPGLGMMFFEGGQKSDEGLNLSLRFGYDISDHGRPRSAARWRPTLPPMCDDGRGDAKHAKMENQSVYGAFADGLYHFDRYSRWDPYLAGGVGYLHAKDSIFDKGDDFGTLGPRVGVGMMYHLSDNLSLRADTRAFMSLAAGLPFIYTADAGVVYRFGGAGSSLAGTGAVVSALPKDSDGDGLTVEEEAKLGTDPFNKDTDGDGLTDFEEVKTYLTNPLNPDTDFDGLKDGEEVKSYKTNPLDRDTDKGGVADGHEVIETTPTRWIRRTT
jgi:opacity protein-like surface antigen